MAVSDALIVGEDWISEHYFTTDATKESFQARVNARRKQWNDEVGTGTDATVRTRFTAARRSLIGQFAALAEAPDPTAAAARIHTELLYVLGYTRPGLTHRHPDAGTADPGTPDHSGTPATPATPGSDLPEPVTRIGRAGLDGDAPGPLAILQAQPAGTIDDLLAKDAPTLIRPYLHQDTDELKSVARTLSTLFVAEDAPAFALVFAGRYALVAERERWAEGRYLAVDLQLVAERGEDKRGGEIDKALVCLSAESLAPDAEGTIWWQDVLADSVRHTVGVSADLRDGVRLSIEIIGNEVVARRRAQGLPPLPAGQAQPLAIQSLRFLYRILFLLYAEASPEMGVLPTGAGEYERGYSLDRLRDLTLVELTSPAAKGGTHLYASLKVLFDLVGAGHDGAPDSNDHDGDGSVVNSAAIEGLTFRNLKADLFTDPATALIDETGLGDEAMQQVLRHLLLSKEAKGADRGFISYAELGINQLGAVYEGLMSYTGFFAEEDLYEVAKNGDAAKGSWVVPIDRADHLTDNDFVTAEDPVTGESKAVIHHRGAFVFRLSGRARQQSASYYTPEVLTRFTVSQALAELLDQDGTTTTARDILDLTVCEPALGSGAFAIEAVRQLAGEYLERRQTELGQRIDPDEYPRALQQVKAYLALHQVYGVDLNATAVELAEISMWLDTMVAGLDAPWFGLHLKRGNSLIGARRAVFRRDQINDKAWLKDVPREVPFTSLADDAEHDPLASGLNGGIHHFLLPAQGWGATTDAKEAKELAPDARDRLRAWQRNIRGKPTKKQTDALVDLSYRVERLWQIALRRLQVAEQEIRRSIDVWGAEDLPVGGRVQRHEIEAALADAGGAYRRLRRVMDAWCALWFWPLTDRLTTRDDGEVVDNKPLADDVPGAELTGGGQHRIDPPNLDQWIDALQGLLGRHTGNRRTSGGGDQTLGSGTTWEELETYEEIDLGFASVKNVADVLDTHPWLRVCEVVAAEQGFFHWGLDFAAPMARGGFDLQVGNPPWVRPTTDVEALLAEGDPWFQLKGKATQAEVGAARQRTLALPGIRDIVVEGTTEVEATGEFVGSAQQYPHLAGLQPDLYRCFMEQTWRHNSARGMVGLIHPESHFTDERAGILRRVTYERLRRHWQFINELVLFEVHHLVSYGVHIYGSVQAQVGFTQATSLYHPDTVRRSLDHQGIGAEPGLKDPDGNWDLRPHSNRIIHVTSDVLQTWHDVLESDDVPVGQTRMVYTVNRSAADVLAKLAKVDRVGSLGLRFSSGWHEKGARVKGFFDSEWGPADSWDDVILQGPHLHVATPFYKAPNETMRHNLDWSSVDLEQLAPDVIPLTSYKPRGDRYEYDIAYTDWGTEDAPKPARDYYRLAWRRMAANTGERTLISGVVPPGAAHVHPVHTLGLPADEPGVIAALAGFVSALILDFTVRSATKSEISFNTIDRLPFVASHSLLPELIHRSLRLNCVTDAYADLWSAAYQDTFADDAWTTSPWTPDPRSLGTVQKDWTPDVPLRRAADRRQALVEIDALVALMLGVTADELCSIYRTQFPVLYGYDRNRDHYDANGRLVPSDVLKVWRSKGEDINLEERTATNQAGYTYTYELPYRTLDREHDMRVAYQEFERRLSDRS